MSIHKYPVKLFYSEEDKGYIVTVPDLPGCSAGGDTPEEALRESKDAIECWLEAARKTGRTIPNPSYENEYSGKILLRLPKSLHRELVDTARDENVSLNQLLLSLISGRAAQRRKRRTA